VLRARKSQIVVAFDKKLDSVDVGWTVEGWIAG
jgi:hypothetical protein